jgi:LPPG:FO 2-phospho-L-lactate transferase
MSDNPWTTQVRTPHGDIHFQEYWVKYRGTIEISAVTHVPETAPVATREVIDAIRHADAVVIGPSNPVTSILPILSCAGVREELTKKKVIAISPFIGEQPVSGPAAALMKAIGYHANSHGVRSLYRDLVDLFIQDIRDPVQVPGAIRRDTLMTSPAIAEDLIKEILSLILRK